MKGLYIKREQKLNANEQPEDVTLLEKRSDIEIMTRFISKESLAWLEPAARSDSFEFFYILSGQLAIVSPDEGMITLNAGDSFALQDLSESVLLRCLQDATVLYVANTPEYESIAYWQGNLMDQLNRIEDKDKYTFRHSKSVAKYAADLYTELHPEQDKKSLEDFLLGALFHDIGKCSIPTEILNKTTRLSNEEFAIIRNHASESEKILRPLFGEEVAELAGLHHERMNGTGYPNGVSGDQIPLGARILMVADSFDAMTSDRVYKKAKGMEEAALELYNMKEEYDPAVTEVLLKLVREGRYSNVKTGS